MSLPLKSFRLRITPETAVALEAEARGFCQDRAEIAREILHAWAVKRLHAARIGMARELSEGLVGADEGMRGRRRR